MVLSKRERYVGVAAIVVVGVIGINQLVVQPLLASKASLDADIATAQDKLQRADNLFTKARRAKQNWSEMAGTTLRKDVSEAESQVLHNVRDWAQEAGLNLSSLKPERTEKEKDFYKISLRAAGNGGMAQIGRFLHRIQTATVPVKVSELSITSRKDGTDDLGLQVAIATICTLPESEKTKSPPPVPPREVAP